MEQNTDRMWWTIVAVVLGGILFSGFLFFTSNNFTPKLSEKMNALANVSNFADAKAAQKKMNGSGIINLDIARHPMSLSELEQAVDQISKNGFTQLELNMGDNEHLMYKSDYLKNTDAAALSIADIQVLVAYATNKGVTILPGLDSPSHAGAILKALQVSHPDVYNKVRLDDNTLDYTTTDSSDLMKILYAELLPAFDNQLAKSFVVGADEVPGNDTTIAYMTPYLNILGNYLRSKGYNVIIWNDSIIKSEVAKLSNNYTIWYWVQGGRHTTDYASLVATRASVKDFVKAGFSVVNANDYANMFQISNIGNTGDETYFLDYLKNTTSASRFDEIVDNQQQWWTEEPSVGNKGMVISLWGENSDGIANSDIINFLGRIQLPN